MRTWSGKSYPLGATWDGAGVNFALFSEHATKVELCLFEAPDAKSDADAPRRIHREAAAAYARQPFYIARLKRREWANGRPRPEETLIFKFREDPWSVHFKWLGQEGQPHSDEMKLEERWKRVDRALRRPIRDQTRAADEPRAFG